VTAWRYVAIDAAGTERRGEIEAADAREAALGLRRHGLYVAELTPHAGEGPAAAGWQRLGHWSPAYHLPVRAMDRAFLFRQLELMLQSGHTVVQALEASREMVPRRRLERALARMEHTLRGGDRLSRAMAAEGDLFTRTEVQLVAAGERGGELAPIMGRLGEDIERREEVRRALFTALTYPAIVFVLASGIAVALVGWVIPRFSTFLAVRGVQLPRVTQILLDLSAWFTEWASWLGGGAVLAVVALVAARGVEPARRALDAALLAVPLLGPLHRAAGFAQVTWTLAMLLRSGVTLLDGLRVAADGVENRALAAALARAGERLLAGEPLSAALPTKRVPHLVRHMASIGERSGELAGVMDLLGRHYRCELEARVKRLAAWVEPLLILVVGSMVGLVYLAFFQAALRVSTGGM